MIFFHMSIHPGLGVHSSILVRILTLLKSFGRSFRMYNSDPNKDYNSVMERTVNFQPRLFVKYSACSFPLGPR